MQLFLTLTTEELQLQDTSSIHLLHMSSVQKALQNVKDDSSDYAMRQILSEAIVKSVEEIV